jgi:hypothetical protein
MLVEGLAPEDLPDGFGARGPRHLVVLFFVRVPLQQCEGAGVLA